MASSCDTYACARVNGTYYMMGVPEVLQIDSGHGMYWFRKSAAQGNPEGMENLKRAREMFGDYPGQP